MIRLYSDDGFAFRDATPPQIHESDTDMVVLPYIPIEPRDDEVSFDHEATETELLKAFPNRAAHVTQNARHAANAPILAELASLDAFLPRAIEDQWVTMNFDTTSLPQVTQDRLARKQTLRKQLQ